MVFFFRCLLLSFVVSLKLLKPKNITERETCIIKKNKYQSRRHIIHNKMNIKIIQFSMFLLRNFAVLPKDVPLSPIIIKVFFFVAFNYVLSQNMTLCCQDFDILLFRNNTMFNMDLSDPC